MTKLLLSFLLVAGISLSGCDNLKSKDSSTDTKEKKKPLKEDSDEDEAPVKPKKPDVTEEMETNSEGQIKNGIIVHENGFKISKAYLSHEDGSLIPAGNEAALNEAVYLNLIVDKGWTVQDGKVSIGASEKIETDAGEKVVDVDDVFATTPPVSEDDAKQIHLKAGVTKTRSSIDHFVVHYRLWDKESKRDVKGSYKLYITDKKEE